MSSEYTYHQRASAEYADGWDRIFGKKADQQLASLLTQVEDHPSLFKHNAALETEPPPYTVVFWPECDQPSRDPTEDEKLIRQQADGLIEQANALGLCVEIFRDVTEDPTVYWVEVWPKPVEVAP